MRGGARSGLRQLAAGERLHGTSSTQPGADQIKQLTYDAAGHVTSNIEGVGTSDAATVATWTYGADGEKLTAADANGYLTTLVYDGFNRLVTTEFPNPTATGQSQTASTGIESYAYDANSNLTTLTRRGGNAVTYGYDNLNRKISSTETVTSGYTNYAYGYDNFSRLTSMSSTLGAGGTQSYSFAYDQLGRKTGETSPVGTASSTWDTAGRRTRLTWPDGFYVNYAYDTDSELTSVQDSTGVTLASLAYDNLGRRTALTRNSGVATSYGYDNASRISSIAHSLPSGQSQTESYTYNVASQVLTKTGSNDGWAWNGGYNFNRSYGVNGLNEQTSAGSATDTWSTKGDLTGDGTLTYSYDTNNQLFLASNGSAQQYDAAGRLYSVGSSGATRFLYDGTMAIAEYNTSGGVNRRFVPGIGTDEPLVWYEGSGTATRYGLTADRMGSITGITTDAGALSAVNSYDEYGIPGTANAGRYQYTGQKYLAEYGMYDYKARVYSPTLGRFVQPDPIGYGDGINFYQYVHSDPTNGWDPGGTKTSFDDAGACFDSCILGGIKGQTADNNTPVDGLDCVALGEIYNNPDGSSGHCAPFGGSADLSISEFRGSYGGGGGGGTASTAPAVPQNNTPKSKSVACQVARQLDAWAKSDANVAFGTAGAGAFGKSQAGGLAVRVGKGLSGISEVFGTASLFESFVSATINGFESNNFSQAVLVGGQKLLTNAAGVEGFSGEVAGKASDAVMDNAGLPTPCDAGG